MPDNIKAIALIVQRLLERVKTLEAQINVLPAEVDRNHNNIHILADRADGHDVLLQFLRDILKEHRATLEILVNEAAKRRRD